MCIESILKVLSENSEDASNDLKFQLTGKLDCQEVVNMFMLTFRWNFYNSFK